MRDIGHKIHKMESFTAQSDNIPENREIGCLATDAAVCKKQLLDGVIVPTKVCLVIGAKSKFSDEIDEKSDKKRRKSSEKRVRFNEVLDFYEEPLSLQFQATIDDGTDADFGGLANPRPLRSIVSSRLRRDNSSGDCINVEDFQERYNHLNKGTSVTRRRQNKRLSKRSFGDFIGLQDFTAPLATMEEIDCFSDESPDVPFKEFVEDGEQTSLDGLLGNSASVYYEDNAGDCHDVTEGGDVECSMYEQLRDTNAVQRLLLKEDFTEAVQGFVAVESSCHTGDRIHSEMVEDEWRESVGLAQVADGMISLVAAAADDDNGVASVSTDESVEPSDASGIDEADANDDARERTMSAEAALALEEEMRKDIGPFALAPCTASDQSVQIDESRVPAKGDCFTMESKVPAVPDDILAILESEVPEDILMVLASKVPVDGSRVPESDDLSRCSLSQKSLSIEKMAVQGKQAEMNIEGIGDGELADALGPLEADVTNARQDDYHLITTEGLTIEMKGVADNEIMQTDDEYQMTPHNAKRKDNDYLVTRRKEQETSADDVIEGGVKRSDDVGLIDELVPLIDQIEESQTLCVSSPEDSPDGSTSSSITDVLSLHSSITGGHDDVDDDEYRSSALRLQLCNAGSPVQTRSSVPFHSSVPLSSGPHSSLRSSSNSIDSVVWRSTFVLVPNLIWLFHSDASSSPLSSEKGRAKQSQALAPGERRRYSAGVTNPRPSTASRIVTEGLLRKKLRPRSGCN